MGSQLKEIFDRCFTVNQSQCALLLGGRNEKVINLVKNCSQEYSASLIDISGLICNDDLQALQCVAQQISDLTGVYYSDTNFQETLNFIRNNLGVNNKIVILVKDIQEFAHKSLKQIFLYTLFELVHEERCMMCVIGVTNRLDFIDILEKRIKSRFSYQIIMMLDKEDLEDLSEGLEQENYNSRAINQLNSFHFIVLIAYMKTAMKSVELCLNSAFKEFEKFKQRGPLIIYNIDKFTFSIITNSLIKSAFLKVIRRHVIHQYTLLKLNFNPESVIYSLKHDSVQVPTATYEWLLETTT